MPVTFKIMLILFLALWGSMQIQVRNRVTKSILGERPAIVGPVERWPGDSFVKPLDMLYITIEIGNTSDVSLPHCNNGFLIDACGDVILPVAGEMYLEGLTMDQAAAKITEAMKQFIKSPIVKISYLSYQDRYPIEDNLDYLKMGR